MALVRRCLLFAVLGATVFVPTAAAVIPPPPTRPSRPLLVGTTHFLVHYTADPTDVGHVTQGQAADIAARAELAYTNLIAWGYAAPTSDGALGGDSRTDLYVVDLTPNGGFATSTQWDGGVGGSSSIDVDPAKGSDQFQIANAYFSVLSESMWTSVSGWVDYSASAWIGMRVQGFPIPSSTAIGPWDESLDCQENFATSTGVPTQNCDKDFFNGSGESRWPFWEYLWEKWGDTFVRDVYARGSAGATGLVAVTNAIAAKGDTFSNVFSAWAAANMSGGYSAAGLQNLTPATSAALAPGTIAGSTSALVTVNHLSTRYVSISRGDPTNTGPCFAASLTINVTVPSGITAVPYVWWPLDGRGVVKALTMSGTTGSITLPWDTCDWGSKKAIVSLPNASATADSQNYTVGTTMTVDKAQILAAAAPPGTVSMPGTVISVPTVDYPPSIDVFGPELIHLSADERILRLIVSSDGAGTLQAALGSLQLGIATLRAGHNDIRFQLSASALTSLRRTAAAGNVLTLTPLSPAGATGQVVLRQVQVDPVLKPTVKPKAKPVTKPKSKPKTSANPKKKTQARR
jgi:hypothetical protein